MQTQTQTSNVRSKKGGARPGAGRPLGSKKTSASIKILAVKILERIMKDETASPEARTMAACKLIDVNQVQP